MIPRYRPEISILDIVGTLFSKTGDPREVESRFADARGLENVVWFPYGRMAIKAFLETLPTELKTVVLSPFNCLALGNAICSAGWKPLYVDVGHESFNQDAEQFALAMDRPDVGAGISTSVWGIPAESSP